MEASFVHITANFSGTARRETFNDREYMVVPLSLIVPGVLNGSNGPLYYSTEELQRDPARWDGFPIVVGHPADAAGKPVSARSPEVLAKNGIGTVFRSTFNGKLAAEGWFDLTATKRIAPQILALLDANQPIELSTGLFAEYDMTPGTYNGTQYAGSVKNIRPDHLAILLSQRGACSIQDGCGVLVNLQKELQLLQNKELEMAKNAEDEKKGLIDSLISNCDCWSEEDRDSLSALSVEKLTVLNAHIDEHKKLVESKAQAEEVIANAAKKGAEELKQPKHREEPKPTANAEKPAEPKTADQWLAEAPVEIQSVVRNAMAMETQQKQALIEKITANKRNTFTKEHLGMKDVAELTALAKLAEEPMTNASLYIGHGGIQHGKNEEAEILPLPTINWAEKTA